MADISSELALIIAGISAGISALSLVISYQAYKRGGASVKIEFDEVDYIGRDLILRVKNHGMAPIQIVGGRIYGWSRPQDEGKRKRLQGGLWAYLPGQGDDSFPVPSPDKPKGPSFPYTLEGNHDVRWLLPRNGEHSKDYVYMQARIELATGKIVSSSKQRIPR